MKHIGIIGGGGISETHARASSEIDGVKLVAFSGRNQQKVARLSAVLLTKILMLS